MREHPKYEEYKGTTEWTADFRNASDHDYFSMESANDLLVKLQREGLIDY